MTGRTDRTSEWVNKGMAPIFNVALFFDTFTVFITFLCK